MNQIRLKIYGKGSSVDFKNEDKKGEFIFVKDKGKIMAFGMMKPVKVKFNGKNYTILGIGRGITVQQSKGWGKVLNAARILELKRIGKTGVAFTGKHNLEFFRKVGYQIGKDGIRKFAYKNPKTGKLEYDGDGDLVYHEGKDKFITKLLKSDKPAITDTDFW
jgi:predicted N-acetyltransferase YhbS